MQQCILSIGEVYQLLQSSVNCRNYGLPPTSRQPNTILCISNRDPSAFRLSSGSKIIYLQSTLLGSIKFMESGSILENFPLIYDFFVPNSGYEFV